MKNPPKRVLLIDEQGSTWHSAAMSQKPAYRPDIDGLRAIAVLLVVFYHFGLGPFTGGFIGVDVFFVISGYLITQILRHDIEAGQFSLIEFYARRVRRIFPALLLTIGAATVAGWFLLMPADYEALGWQAGTAILGLSNFYFYSATGYFAPNADLQPLLHTWSLAVEEQFYIFWPVTLALCWRATGGAARKIATAIAALVALSFLLSVYQVHQGASAAFYMLPFRAWELGLGALLSFAPAINKRWLSELLVVAGIGAILSSAFLLKSTMHFPGYNAVYPCVGAALIIAPKASSRSARLLSLAPLTLVGKISFSLYLWHWPVLVLFRHIHYERQPSNIEAALMLLLCLVLAWLSWKFVERPFRNPMLFPHKRTFSIAAVFTSIMVVTALGISWQNGVPSRLPGSALSLAQGVSDVSPKRAECHRPNAMKAEPISDSCVFGDQNVKPNIFVWGDSHGVEISYALGELLQDRNQSVMSVTYSSCVAALDVNFNYSPGCANHNSAVLDYLSESADISTVILIGRYAWSDRDAGEAFRVGIAAAIEAVTLLGKSVVIVDPVPEFPTSVPHAASRMALYEHEAALQMSREDYLGQNKATLDLLDTLTAKHDLRRVSTTSALCRAEYCFATRNGRALYYDNHHLSMTGARIVAPSILDALQQGAITVPLGKGFGR